MKNYKFALAAVLAIAGCNSQPDQVSNLSLNDQQANAQLSSRLTKTRSARDLLSRLDQALQPLETALKEITLTLQGNQTELKTNGVVDLQGVVVNVRDAIRDSARGMTDYFGDDHWALVRTVPVSKDITGGDCGEITVSIYGVTQGSKDSLELWVQKCADVPTILVKATHEDGRLSAQLNEDGIRYLLAREINFGGCKMRVNDKEVEMSCQPISIVNAYPTYIYISELKAKVGPNGFSQHTKFQGMNMDHPGKGPEHTIEFPMSNGEKMSFTYNEAIPFLNVSLDIEPNTAPKVVIQLVNPEAK